MGNKQRGRNSRNKLQRPKRVHKQVTQQKQKSIKKTKRFQNLQAAVKNSISHIADHWLADITMTVLGLTLLVFGNPVLFGVGFVYLIWLVIYLLWRNWPTPIGREWKRSAVIIGVMISVTVVLSVAIKLKYFPTPEPEPEFSGTLIPTNEPTPKTDAYCLRIPPNPFGIYYGDSVAYFDGQPATIVEISKIPLLKVTKNDNEIRISAKLFDEDGKIVAEITDNEFSINRNNFFEKKRPDRSSLIVRDQKGVEVLNVRYVNSSAIKVSGLFRYKDRSVMISQDKTFIGRTSISRACSVNPNVVIAQQ